MLYVLADNAGGIWYYHDGAPNHTGSNPLDKVLGTDTRRELPPGASVLVFATMPEAYKFIKVWTLPGGDVPGRQFEPQAAMKSDLGKTVCFTHSDGMTRESYTFDVQPTPADAVQV